MCVLACRVVGEVQRRYREAARGGDRTQRAAAEPAGTGHESEAPRVQRDRGTTQTS